MADQHITIPRARLRSLEEAEEALEAASRIMGERAQAMREVVAERDKARAQLAALQARVQMAEAVAAVDSTMHATIDRLQAERDEALASVREVVSRSDKILANERRLIDRVAELEAERDALIGARATLVSLLTATKTEVGRWADAQADTKLQVERLQAENAALRAAWRTAVKQADHDMILTRDEIRHHYAAIDAARGAEGCSDA